MEERFTCPHCGEELTAIAVELKRLQDQYDELNTSLDKIIVMVFDDDELGSISDRQDTDETS